MVGVAAATISLFGIVKADAASIQNQDFYLSYRYIPDNAGPGYPSSVPEEAVNLSYVNKWTYGANLLSLDAEQFSLGSPSYGIAKQANLGSTEFVAVYRTTLSGNKISGTRDFAIGPFSDIGLQLGGDYELQNTSVASYKRVLVGGPEFDIAIPKGFWSISTMASHEWNTFGFAYPDGPATSYAPTYQIETSWLYPFNVGPLALQFTGYGKLVGPKGRGYTEPAGYKSDYYHKTEILFHPKLMVDAGRLIGYKPGKLMTGIGYEFWMNKYGDYKPHTEGAQQSSIFLEVGYNFN
jgi:nucleoside-specific outer membrane channel protein Tsx